MGLFGFGKKEKDKMKDGLEKTRTGFWGNILNTLTGSKIDDDLYDELEEQLILADVGGDVAMKLVDALRDRVERLEDDVKVYHARTDERLKTLFQTCEKLSSTAATLLRAALTILGIVLIVSVFALVYGAVGHDGFNAVTRARRGGDARVVGLPST